MMELVDKALGSEVSGEKTGTKFDIDSSHDAQQKAIEENIKKVAKMSSVAKLTGKEFEKSEIDLVTQVSNFFDKQGNQAQSSELGNVTLDRRGVKDDIAHGIGRKKAASFAAVRKWCQTER